MKDVSYDKITDEQLVTLIKSGDYELFGALRNRYMPYIVKSASRYNSAMETEDLVSEGVLSLFLAVKSYEPEKASFKAFAFMCIERGILAQYRHSKALKRIPAELVSSIDDFDNIADSNNPESLLIEKESYNSLFGSVKMELSDFEYRVLREFICGKSYREIADELGKPPKSVDNALKRAREKLSVLKLY